jgi:integrase
LTPDPDLGTIADMPRAEWRGSVYLPADRRRLYLRVRVGGRWISRPTPYPDTPEGRALAERMLAAMRSQLQAEEAAGAGDAPLTVERWAATWLETRRDPTFDRIHLDLHVLPAIGPMPLARLEPRHLLELVDGWRAAGAAARTIRNRYATIHAMCRDAAVRGLIPQSPAILSRPAHLPAIEDVDPEWRSSAVLSRTELERLLGASGPADSAVAWHVLGLAGLRHGELAALRWRHYDAERQPLGSLLVARSNARARTKTGKARQVPVLPALAAVLAAWRLTGWERFVGRAPGPDDLLIPLRGLRGAPEPRMRTKGHTLRRLHRALAALELRPRRVHDLRRTWISLCLSDGADRETLRWASHGRPGDVMGAYTEIEWEKLCGEVGKLKVRREPPARVVPLRRPRRT